MGLGSRLRERLPAGGERDASGRSPFGIGAVGLAMVMWGFTGALVKLTTLDGLDVAFYRLWMGAAVFVLALGAARRRALWRDVAVGLAGGVLFGVNNVFFFGALKATSIVDTLIIANLQPLLVLVVAGRWFGERVGVREVFFTLVATAGVLLVVVGSSRTSVWSLGGDLLAVAALVTWTAFFLFSKRVRAGVRALDYMTGVMVGAAITATPLALVHAVRTPTARDWLWLAILVGGPGALGQLLVAWAHAHVDVSISSLVLLGVPVVAALAGLVIVREPLGPLQIVGGLVVLGGIAAVVRRAPAAAPEAEPG